MAAKPLTAFAVVRECDGERSIESVHATIEKANEALRTEAIDTLDALIGSWEGLTLKASTGRLLSRLADGYEVHLTVRALVEA